MSSKSNQPDSVLELWSIVRRYRGRFVLPAFIITTLVLLGSLMLPRKYKATATFERRTDMVLHEMMSQGASRSFQDPRSSLRAELLGQPAIDQVIEDVKASPEAREALRRSGMDLQQLRRELNHRITMGHDIASQEIDRIWVAFVTLDPKLAQFCVNRLIENHIAESRRRIDARLRASTGFFEHEANEARELIDKYENEKLKFQIDHAELLPEHPGGIQATLATKQAEHQDATQKLEMARLRVEALQEQLETIPEKTPTVIEERNPQLAKLEAALNDANQRLIRMRDHDKMTAKHPDMIDLSQQIESLEAKIASTEKRVITQTRVDLNPQRKQTELQLAEARASTKAYEKLVAQLAEQLKAIDAETAQLFPVRADYIRLERQIAETERQLGFWENQKRRVEMALTAESGDRGIQMSFMAPAGMTQRPISPDLAQVLLFALTMGGVCGALSVFLAYRSDNTYAYGSDLAEALSLPLLGSVSEIISRQQRRARRLRKILLWPVQGAAMATVFVAALGIVYLSLMQPDRYQRLLNNPSLLINWAQQARDQVSDADRDDHNTLVLAPDTRED